MSTRCQIGIYEKKETDLTNFEALLYRHSDGYPDGEHGVLAAIVPFCKFYHKARGMNDTEYLAARLLQYLCNEYDKAMSKYEQITPKIDGLQYTGLLGNGISKVFHWDIEYFYAISPGLIRVYETPFESEPKNYKLIQTIEI